MTVALFHGTRGLLAAGLLVIGACTILTAAENWLRDRFTLHLNPYRIHLLGSRRVLKGSLDWDLHISIPRRFCVHLRWDRAGGHVRLDDGREGFILYVLEHDDAPYPIVLVQPYDANNDPDLQCPEWISLPTLSPLPRRTLRDTWREIRGTGNEGA